MRLKFVIGAVVSLAGLLLFGAVVQFSAVHRPAQLPPWEITRTVSAHFMLVAYVDAWPDADLSEIGPAIVARSRNYEEILIYIRTGTTVRRVQWTSRDGFREMQFYD